MLLPLQLGVVCYAASCVKADRYRVFPPLPVCELLEGRVLDTFALLEEGVSPCWLT